MTLNEALGRGTWPPPGLRDTWGEVELFAAFRSSNATRLRQEKSVGWWRDYMVSPVPRMISRASANLLVGEPADHRAAVEADQGNLDRIVTENMLDAEEHRGAMIASSEGEVWGRIVVDPSLLDVPIIEFVSRARVIPHFAGRFVAGATFVTEYRTGTTERFRLFETYDRGAVVCRLFRGTTTSLGGEVALDSLEVTAGKAPVVFTGIDWPLVAFIPNTIDADPCRGYSDYAGLQDRFFAVNEAATVGQHNLRLAGRKRAIIDGGYLRDGQMPKDDDVFIRTSRQGGDDASSLPLQVIDYSFQADQTIAWVDHLIDTTLSFAGVAPQQVGRSVDGGAISGTALKLKMAHSLLESAGKGRFLDRGIVRLLRGAQIIDGRPVTEGGFGRTYSQRDGEPTVERQDGLPRDDMEAAQELSYLVSAEAISIEERVAFQHPDWDEARRIEEIKRLKAETLQLPDSLSAAPASQE